MFIVPQKYTCQRCGHVFLFSPHVDYPAPVTTDGEPACTKCWDQFLRGIGVGTRVVDQEREAE